MKKCIMLIFLTVFINHPFYAQDPEVSAEADTLIPLVSKPVILAGTRGVAYGSPAHFSNSTMFGEATIQASWRTNQIAMGASFRHREGVAFGKRISIPELREAWAGYVSPRFDLILGNQIVTWGKTDGFNPTNHITPVDYFMLSGEADDQKMSNFMLQAKIRPFRNGAFTLIGIPVFRPSVYRFELFDMGEQASFLPAMQPDQELRNGSWAMKADLQPGRMDLALSYFQGYSPEFGFNIDTVILLPKTDIRYRPDYYHTRTAGIALAVPLGRNILRGEAAWHMTSDYKHQMHIPNPDIGYVAGFEREILGTTTILQYIGKHTLDYLPLEVPVLSNPLDLLAQLQYAFDLIDYESTLFNRKIFYQQEKNNHAMSLSLVRSFAWDRFSVHLTGYYNITSAEKMGRVGLTWNINDQLKATVGGSVMTGPENSIFDKAAPVMNGAWFSIKTNI
jgi:hypothetical protein